MGFGGIVKALGGVLANPMIAGGAMTMGADLYSAKQARDAQANANNSNVAFSVGQNAWQKMMSDTSHQREVADLKAAGLNPVLSANAGASTPVGSTPEVDALPPSIPKGILRDSMSSALEIRRLKKDIDEADSRIKLNNKQSGKIGQDIMAQKPLADLGTTISRGIEKLKTSGKQLKKIIDEGPPEFDGDQYITSAEQQRRAHNARNQKRYSPRGKNVPLYIGD